mgnify:CR=1 FL=1
MYLEWRRGVQPHWMDTPRVVDVSVVEELEVAFSVKGSQFLERLATLGLSLTAQLHDFCEVEACVRSYFKLGDLAFAAPPQKGGA